MRTKKTSVILSAAFMFAFASVVIAQDDLDNLLNDLEKPAAKEKAAAPATEAPAAAEPAAAAPVAAAAEAPAAKEKKEEAKEEVAPAAAPVVAAAVAPVAAEKKEEVAAAPAVATEEKKEEAPAAAPAPAAAAPVAVAPANSDLPDEVNVAINTEKLRREALQKQAEDELVRAKDAMSDKDWAEAIKQFGFANQHFVDTPDNRANRAACKEGIAEANYQAGIKFLKEANYDIARDYFKAAMAMRHPKAGKVLEAMDKETHINPGKDISEIKHRRNDEDYKKNRVKFQERLRLASQYLAVSDLDRANEQCELVLRADPYNQEAISLRNRVQRRRQLILDNERQATRRSMIADVDAAWRPIYAIDSTELKEIDGATLKTPTAGNSILAASQDIEQRMKEMILPTISFRPPATIIDAVDYFRQASKDFDKPEIPADQRGFNFVLDLGRVVTSAGADNAASSEDSNDFSSDGENTNAAAQDGVPLIPNISASNISLHEALSLVCKVSKFQFKIQGKVVMVMPADMTTDEMESRSYDVTENFAERMNNASSEVKEKKSSFDSNDSDSEGGDGTDAWKGFFEQMGVKWPKGSSISYIKTIGKLYVNNTLDQLAVIERVLEMMNATQKLIEIETRFVEVAQEDLNSLGFEWLLNSDYSLDVGGKLGKMLGLKHGNFPEYDGVTPVTTGYTENFAETVVENLIPATATSGETGKTIPVNSGATVWQKDTSGLSSRSTTTTYTTTIPKQGSYANRSWSRYDAYGNKVSGRRNIGISAVDGTSMNNGMRYLSTESNHIMGEGESVNDQFMRVNAFLGNADLSMILHMLSQRSDTDLLSAPKVVAKSGESASIREVTVYRYPQDYNVTIQSTSSSSSSNSGGSGGDGKILPMVEPQNFTTEEVGVILEVTPTLSEESGIINLELHPRVVSEPTWKDYGMRVPMSAVEPSSTGSSVYDSVTGALTQGATLNSERWFNVPMEQPFFKRREIETKVSLYNGATVVMGGLITEDRKSMEDKIPFLGDIPFIGRLFRSRSEWTAKRNLLIFVTARLVDLRGRAIAIDQESDLAPVNNAPVTPAPAPADK